jgi:hypothetical protein
MIACVIASLMTARGESAELFGVRTALKITALFLKSES